MNELLRRWRVSVACAAIALCTTAASAMVVVPAEFSEMVTASDLVVQGRVVAVRPQIVGDRRTIETVITVAVVDALKGQPGETGVLPRARRSGRSLSARDGWRARVRRRRGGRALPQGPGAWCAVSLRSHPGRLSHRARRCRPESRDAAGGGVSRRAVSSAAIPPDARWSWRRSHAASGRSWSGGR